MQRRLAFNIFAFGAAIALVVSSPPGARAQSLPGNPDHVGVLRMLNNSCLPHAPVPLGTTIAGVFIPAIPGTMARFECVGPDFREQTFTCGLDGVYDVVVAGAQGGRGPSESFSMPQLGRFVGEGERGMGGLGGVVRGRMILKAGTVLYIDVGQRGDDGGVLTPGGGGGGTFVLDAAKNPIAVAAGGGGSGYDDGGGSRQTTYPS